MILKREDFLNDVGEDEILYLKYFIEGCTKRKMDLSHLHVALYTLSKNLPEKAKYAEIGSHVGGSALSVKYGNRFREIFCYDLPNGGWGGINNSSHSFRKSLNGFRNVQFNTGSSHSEIIKSIVEFNGPYDLFLVDGDHSDEGAYEDLELAFLNLKAGGTLIFDDTVHHPYLKDTFIRFCRNKKLNDYILIDHLTGMEIKYKFQKRGLGILKK